MRSYVVDTLAALIFFTVVAAFSEYVIAGLGARQVLVSRLTTVPVLFLTGWPYGLWRDWLVRRMTGDRPGRMLFADTTAFLSFQVPVYLAILAIAGARPPEMAAALGSAIVLMVILSRPYGLFLDWFRVRTSLLGRGPVS
ncbi:MAG: L-alanine exporter AlaE [Rhizobiaceae bacterium]|nr:L-alanine exporter AlaE [Rhizobiaceae bacterium]MCV0405340.1 L-alanine exporter AlaE [Rhizobiaceae bacterium]